MSEYANPAALVSTDWVAQHLSDPNVQLVEVDVDTTAYSQGHVPGAVGWDWGKDLCDTVRRDIVPSADFETLMANSGIGNDTTVVLYGDNNNWFAAWALWQMKVYGHADVRLMDGGRKKWLAEDRTLTTDTPPIPSTAYVARAPDASLRAFLPEVQAASAGGTAGMVDVRSPQEYSGEILAPPGLPETCQRGGHVPGAANIPWGLACREDGSFKSADELRDLYANHGITNDRPTITYCRIGERSSHSWFALKYLLGFENVKNYDGSWTEWGNLVGAPVER